MTIGAIIQTLESLAHPAYQESYDNAGLITGRKQWECTGVLVTLDATEEIIEEAIRKNCNMVVAHHPILFRPLQKLSGDGYAERAIVKAIQHNIAIYAIHTNLDNVQHGVNLWMAEKIGLVPGSLRVLAPKRGLLWQLVTYVPEAQAAAVRDALFAAGAGAVGQYVECSFNSHGQGSFRPLENTNPAIGSPGGQRETVAETRLELVFAAPLQAAVVAALRQAHPYETVAYSIIELQNEHQDIGSGLVGELPESLSEADLLHRLKAQFNLQLVRHTPLLQKPVKRIALCGGAGSFLTKAAIGTGADAFITADIKYHEFFDADRQLLLADIGHFESEQFTTQGIASYLQSKFPTFAVLQTEVCTNPVQYFF
ncbi:MAG TPA: Nif3-like dinuclear metal center hexameric protein [Phnomibacter sp.]|nr:Nif3-like dinuclear metal center hexameric protein [Phnomibacter sp.]